LVIPFFGSFTAILLPRCYPERSLIFDQVVLVRRTAASMMTGVGIPRLTVSKILNHVEPGVTAVYDRHRYDKEKREALAEWSKRLTLLVSDLGEVKGEA
jgi:hypothetical protein